MKSGHAQNQRGFGVIDMMVAVALLAIVTTLLMDYTKQSTNELRAKRVGENISEVTKLFTRYLVAYRGDATSPMVIQAMTDGTAAASYCSIFVDPATGAGTTAVNTTKHTCAVDLSFLKWKKMIPLSYPEINSFGQRWTAVYRLVYEDFDNNPTTPDTTDGSVEMLVVGATNSGDEVAMDSSTASLAASIAGFNGGYIPNGEWGNCHYDAGNKEACAAGASWSVDLDKFLNNP